MKHFYESLSWLLQMVYQILIFILPAPEDRKDQLLLALCTSCGELANPCHSGTETLINFCSHLPRCPVYVDISVMTEWIQVMGHKTTTAANARK